MTPFEIVAVLGALAGVLMVLGGILLFYKGALTLQATPQDAITLEWKKQFKISTQVPGIAFFLVGLLFVVVSLFYLKPPPIIPIEIEGQISGVDQPVSLAITPAKWELQGDTTGKIQGKVYPDLSVLLLVVNAPGYEPFTQSISVKEESRKLAKVGTLQLTRKVNISDIKENLIDIPFPAPPTTLPNQKPFGVAQ